MIQRKRYRGSSFVVQKYHCVCLYSLTRSPFGTLLLEAHLHQLLHLSRVHEAHTPRLWPRLRLLRRLRLRVHRRGHHHRHILLLVLPGRRARARARVLPFVMGGARARARARACGCARARWLPM